MDPILRLGLGSIVVGVVVLGLKWLAFMMTGSVALYSDALESLVNLATAGVTLFAVRLSLEPPDANHHFGHHKVEYFSAVFAGVLIVVAAMAILREAWAAYLAPRVLDAPFEGAAVNLVAAAINGTWATILVRYGRLRRSPALAADGRHLMSDVMTSIGVVAGVLLAAATGWSVLDPAMAAAVAVGILWSGWVVIRDSLGGLMDVAVPEETQARIRDVISEQAGGALEAHDLRTRRAGPAIFVEFHLVVAGEMTVAELHEICDRIEEALKAGVPGARPVIHVEPEHKAKHPGGVPVI